LLLIGDDSHGGLFYLPVLGRFHSATYELDQTRLNEMSEVESADQSPELPAEVTAAPRFDGRPVFPGRKTLSLKP
jgi:hypothetical protein